MICLVLEPVLRPRGNLAPIVSAIVLFLLTSMIIQLPSMLEEAMM